MAKAFGHTQVFSFSPHDGVEAVVSRFFLDLVTPDPLSKQTHWQVTETTFCTHQNSVKSCLDPIQGSYLQKLPEHIIIGPQCWDLPHEGSSCMELECNTQKITEPVEPEFRVLNKVHCVS